MADLNKLVADIIADGKVDASEVETLRKVLYEDGVIDRNEANALFQINNAVSGNQNDPSWATFFVEAITTHVLSDESSPGVVDEEEATWLMKSVEGDGTIDEIEKALLRNIKAKAKSITKNLSSKMDEYGV